MTEWPALVVTGMHRSGTSLVASILSALGVRMGESLIEADRSNPRGFWEDSAFVQFNQRILTECTASDDGGHRDWGWTESEKLDQSRFREYLDGARTLVSGRHDGRGYWGWKDPRTTLLLDLWDEALEGAHYLLVYRFPWEVADSMQRLGADVFLDHPSYAYRIWAFYNRRLLDFYRTHTRRALLVSANALVQDVQRLESLLAGKFRWQLPDRSLDGIFDAELFTTFGATDPLIGLVAATSPHCTSLLTELDEAADLSASGIWQVPSTGTFAPEPGDPVDQEIDLSVVIPCCDHGDFLVEALASVERSVPGDREIIIVNDGSQQARTVTVLETLKELGYRVIDQENAGLSAARNRGIRAAAGRFIVPLDADNRLRPGFTEAACGILAASPEVGVVYGDRFDFGKQTGKMTISEFDLPRLLMSNFIDACAVFRKSVWEDVGGYDVEMDAWEDWDFWIGAAESGWDFQHIPEITFDYRVRPNSLLSICRDPTVRARLVERVVRRHQELYERHQVDILREAQDQIRALRHAIKAFEKGKVQHLAALKAGHARDKEIYEAEIERIKSLLEEFDGKIYAQRDLIEQLTAEKHTRRDLIEQLTAEKRTQRDLIDQLTAEKDALRGSKVGRLLCLLWDSYLGLRRALIRARGTVKLRR